VMGGSDAGATPNDAVAAAAAESTRRPSSAGGELAGYFTPRQQYSPGLRARAALAAPGTSPNTLALPPVGSLPAAAGTFSFNPPLDSVPQSPPGPSMFAAVPGQQQQAAAPSASALLSELGGQSFQSLAYGAARTSYRAGDEFVGFMHALEQTPQQAQQTAHSSQQPQQLHAHPERRERRGSGELTALLSGKPLALQDSPAPVKPSLQQQHSPQDDSKTLDGDALDDDESEWRPDSRVLQPLAPSTLELHFPQLASFDLYLHSEIE